MVTVGSRVAKIKYVKEHILRSRVGHGLYALLRCVLFHEMCSTFPIQIVSSDQIGDVRGYIG